MSFNFEKLPLGEKEQLICDWIEDNDKARYRKPYPLFAQNNDRYPQSYNFHRSGVFIATPVDDI